MADPENRRKHNRYQRRVFEDSVEFFRTPIPADVERRTGEIVAAAGLAADDRVLDVGTGVGVLIPHIQRFGVRQIVGCDLSEAMLSEARNRYPGVTFWCGDVVDLPEGLGPFDAVFFNAVFGNLWDQREALHVSARHLNRGGRIVISHPMGAAFAKKLKQEDPRMVPHPLPGKARLGELIRGIPLKLKEFRDETELYLCVLQGERGRVSNSSSV